MEAKDFILEHPDLSEIDESKVMNILVEESVGPENIIKTTFEKEYLYWDRFKYKKPPGGLSPEEYWYFTKLVRKINSVRSTIKATDGRYFQWCRLTRFEPFLHSMDMHTGGRLIVQGEDIQERKKRQYISRGILEESIASSQLEGANTTRKAAKQLIREKRTPKSKSEHMIFNNYYALTGIEERYRNQELNLDLIFELHSLLTKNTIANNAQGVFRKDGDHIVVTNVEGSIIYHKAPPMKFVRQEIMRFIDFANDIPDGMFIHPIIRAIMIHFWMGYLHPFVDGNGRLARILFFWYLLKHDYWAFAYLPISKMIRKSPVQYKMAYVYSEQDSNDLTYFIDYNINKISLAMNEFQSYMKRKANESLEMNRLSRIKYNLNSRQIDLLQYLHSKPDERTSPSVHQRIHQVTRTTATTDLKRLEELGFLRSKKTGRSLFFYPTKKTDQLFG